MKSRFWQVSIKEEDMFKIAFSVPGGHNEWNVMPFGIKNALSHFQRMMDTELHQVLREGWLIIYIDDIIIFTETWEEHLSKLSLVLK